MKKEPRRKETYVFELQYLHIRAVIIDYYHEPDMIIESPRYSEALLFARRRFKKIKKLRLTDLDKIQVVSCQVVEQLNLFE